MLESPATPESQTALHVSQLRHLHILHLLRSALSVLHHDGSHVSCSASLAMPEKHGGGAGAGGRPAPDVALASALQKGQRLHLQKPQCASALLAEQNDWQSSWSVSPVT